MNWSSTTMDRDSFKNFQISQTEAVETWKCIWYLKVVN